MYTRPSQAKTKWTKKMDRILTERTAAGIRAGDIAIELGISSSAIPHRQVALGLKERQINMQNPPEEAKEADENEAAEDPSAEDDEPLVEEYPLLCTHAGVIDAYNTRYLLLFDSVMDGKVSREDYDWFRNELGAWKEYALVDIYAMAKGISRAEALSGQQ